MQIGKSTQNKIIASTVVGAAILSGFLFWTGVQPPLFAVVKSSFHPSDVWIVDRAGYPLEAIRTDAAIRKLDWTKLDEISPSFLRLLVQSEDARFYQHHGIDFLALGHAGVLALQGTPRGASTISMQVVNLFSHEHSMRLAARVARKFRQFIGAEKVERSWSKSEILEAYVNLVSYRGEVVGIRAASLGLFAKSPAALNEIESALLIALIRAPNASIAKVVTRACRILPETDCVQVSQIAQNTIANPYQLARAREQVPILAHAFVRTDLNKTGVIETTLDRSIQALALEAVHEQLATLRDRNVKDAAVIVLDTRTGTPLAYIGNGGPGFTSREQIDGVTTLRQAGSTLKPFVYATAFDMRYLDIASLVEDSQQDFAVGGGGVYSPKDYDPVFHALSRPAKHSLRVLMFPRSGLWFLFKRDVFLIA